MDNRAYESLPKVDDDLFQVGADGELLDAVFCLRCGTMNKTKALICVGCDDFLLEQGSELRAQLARIRRSAGGKLEGAVETQEFRAFIRQSIVPTKQNSTVNPKHQELMARIAETARSIDAPPITNSAAMPRAHHPPQLIGVFVELVFLALTMLGIALANVGLAILMKVVTGIP